MKKSILNREVGVNNDREIKIIKKLILPKVKVEEASIKFHTHKTESLDTKKLDLTKYQKRLFVKEQPRFLY